MVILPSYVTQTHIAPNALAELALCRNLKLEELFWLSERLRYKTFPAEASFITAETPGEVVYIILRGTVKIHIEQLDGTDVVLAILGKGDTVGEMSLIDSSGRSASAVTLEESTLLWLDRQTFQEALQTFPGLAFNLVRILSSRVRLANEHIQALATLDVYGRVARQLLAFSEKYGEEDSDGGIRIPIHLTQSDIADLVGASRKRVNQVMVAFKQHGYITVDQNSHISVHDRAALARLCR
jgi:CRP/FNR family cyclic AMP-dependent transcriptional regulator